MLKPFDLDVSNDDLQAANDWWQNLSNNQMKEYHVKYFPNVGTYLLGKRWVHQMWEAEGKPQPQELIPVVRCTNGIIEPCNCPMH